MVAELAAGALGLELEQLVLVDRRLVDLVDLDGDREPGLQFADPLAVLVEEPFAELLGAAIWKDSGSAIDPSETTTVVLP